MRYLFGFIFVLALGVMGCGQGLGPMGGAGGAAGMGGVGGGVAACVDNICPCTEAGIRAAIAEGGGPFTFECDGPTTVRIEQDIVIDNDVILDGEGKLTVDGTSFDSSLTVFSVEESVNAELHRLTVTGGHDVGVANEGTLVIQDCVISGNRSEEWSAEDSGGGIFNAGEMTIVDTTISDNFAGHGAGGGISNASSGVLRLVHSSVSNNGADGDGPGLYGGGISNGGAMTIVNSTISGNRASDAVFGGALGGGIANAGRMYLINSTMFGNRADSGDAIAIQTPFHPHEYVEIANTLLEGDCARAGDESDPVWVSNGYNIESPGNTCGFDQGTDKFDVSAEELKLGPLQDNGGPTMTHALGAGSVAIDVIPEAECDETTDQRGQPRPETGGTMCDVGAFEVQQHCFQDDECGPLICCHLGSPFEQGTCQTQSVCDELQGGA